MIALASSSSICQLPWQLLFRPSHVSISSCGSFAFPPPKNINQIWLKLRAHRLWALGSLCLTIQIRIISESKTQTWTQLSRNSSIIHNKYSFVQKLCIHFVFDVSLIEFARCFWQLSLSIHTQFWTHYFILIELSANCRKIMFKLKEIKVFWYSEAWMLLQVESYYTL